MLTDFQTKFVIFINLMKGREIWAADDDEGNRESGTGMK
jgi:hypothetical protein